MKRIIRILSLVLVLMLMSSIVTSAMAYDINCGYAGSATKRTYNIYHTWGKAVTISRCSAGTCELISNLNGKYSWTVTYPNGTKKSGVADLDSNSKVTIIPALSGTGNYKIEISKVKASNLAIRMGLSDNSHWYTYPRYQLNW